jgi:hypothetical protein
MSLLILFPSEAICAQIPLKSAFRFHVSLSSGSTKYQKLQCIQPSLTGRPSGLTSRHSFGPHVCWKPPVHFGSHAGPKIQANHTGQARTTPPQPNHHLRRCTVTVSCADVLYSIKGESYQSLSAACQGLDQPTWTE